MTKNNSVHEMVDALKRIGPMTENEIHKAAFGYDRNTSIHSNKKYADMLKRGLDKGIIKRRNIKGKYPDKFHGNTKYLYYNADHDYDSLYIRSIGDIHNY